MDVEGRIFCGQERIQLQSVNVKVVIGECSCSTWLSFAHEVHNFLLLITVYGLVFIFIYTFSPEHWHT